MRFGNGLPATQDGKIAFPAPQALTERKGKRDGIKDDRIVTEHIRIAPHRFDSEDGKTTELGESLKPCFLTPEGEIVMPRTGYRLKTAIEKGRAAESRLFGYQHIAAGTRFAASLEADDDETGLSDELFDRLLAVFSNKSILLGRSRRAEYGGEIHCHVEKSAASQWPECSGPLDDGEIIIWLLSDLALDNDAGVPALPPPPGVFGLPPGSRFLDSSVVTVRRYSPFNGYLRRPDLERTVIGAGSVLRYDYKGPAEHKTIDCSAGFGIFREQGLGRVWINPPILKGKTPRIQPADFLPIVTSPSEKEVAAADPYAADLLAWLEEARAESAFQKDCEDRAKQYFDEIKQLYETARAISGNQLAGPGRSQWGRITGLCATAGLDFPHLRRSLTGEPGKGNGKVKGAAQPICKGEGWGDEGMPDGADKLLSFAGWMKQLVEDQRWAAEDGGRALPETLGRLAERVRLQLVKEG